MAFDSARGVTVLFGGGFNNGDTWEWDGTTWSERASSGPAPRAWHAMAYDTARRVTVLFGGDRSGVLDGETWEWDGSVWSLRAGSGSGPQPRYTHAIAYDSARGVTVLFGGRGFGSFLGDTWTWDGAGDASWTNYGSGWPGTNGIPSFTATGDPVLCGPITLELANSLGASTTAVLFLGLAPTDQLTSYDGHVLVALTNLFLLGLPGAGLGIPGIVPCENALCGRSVYLQALEVDPGASRGVSFTPGLKLVFGS
jgi:hypothetical protein